MKEIFSLTRKTKRLIVIMFIITAITLIAAYFYYERINRLEDPRTVAITEMYIQYNQYVSENDFYNVIAILDTMEQAYKQIDHYRDSFEIGVIYTDRAAAYLTMALYNTEDEKEKAAYLNIADANLATSLEYYKKWESVYKNRDRVSISEMIRKDFPDNFDRRDKIIEKRAGTIEKALSEMNQRKSVTYTNLGIVKRHQGDLELAVKYYQEAIDLWENNISAKSNLNVLLGGEPIKQNFIQKLFPPEKDK